MDQLLTIEHFQNKENEQFLAKTDQGGTVAFTLIEVEALPIRNKKLKRAPFSLVFNGPKEAQFKQATIELTHPSFETPQPIFMVAIELSQDTPDTLNYQAVFN